MENCFIYHMNQYTQSMLRYRGDNDNLDLIIYYSLKVGLEKKIHVDIVIGSYSVSFSNNSLKINLQRLNKEPDTVELGVVKFPDYRIKI